MSTSLPRYVHGLVDDAAIFPPGDAPLDLALRANRAWQRTPHARLVGTFVVDDRRLAGLGEVVDTARRDGVTDLDDPFRVSVVVTGGAGAVAPALRRAATSDLEVAGVEVALRDPGDLAGNARRVVAAVDAATADGELDDDVPVYVELPRPVDGTPTPDWLAALDEIAAPDLRLKLRTGGVHADAFPGSRELAASVGAALDRELQFKCTAGLHNALRHRDDETGFEHHGFLNVLLATRASLDGSSLEDVAAVLDETDADALTTGMDAEAMTGARRWFTSFGSCSVRDPLDDLTALGLLERP